VRRSVLTLSAPCPERRVKSRALNIYETLVHDSFICSADNDYLVLLTVVQIATACNRAAVCVLLLSFNILSACSDHSTHVLFSPRD
jgi:hypothetical protein